MIDAEPLDEVPRHDRLYLEQKAFDVLHWFRPDHADQVVGTDVRAIVDALHHRGKLLYRPRTRLGLNRAGDKRYGAFDLGTRELFTDDQVGEAGPLYRFVLAHELGHFVLHRTLKLDFASLDEPAGVIGDARRSFARRLRFGVEPNDRDRLEWQANGFADALLMPARAFSNVLRLYQDANRIRRSGLIFVDDQRENLRNFDLALKHLAVCFMTSRSAVLRRLRALSLLMDRRGGYSTSRSVREALIASDLAKLLDYAPSGDID